jgi:hypothetical protein
MVNTVLGVSSILSGNHTTLWISSCTMSKIMQVAGCTHTSRRNTWRNKKIVHTLLPAWVCQKLSWMRWRNCVTCEHLFGLVLGKVLGMMLGNWLGEALGLVLLGRVLGKMLGEVPAGTLGEVLGEVLGKMLGGVLVIIAN